MIANGIGEKGWGVMDIRVRLKTLIDRHGEIALLMHLIRANNANAWLVGGCLRDWLLDRDVFDLDIAVAGDPTALAKQWAAQSGGRWFWLDEDRCQSRVLTVTGLTVDFTPLRAPGIEADLSLRDFRVNAMALPLAENLSSVALYDPLNGQDDLQQGHLCFCSERSPIEDPLRMLKGVRHTVTLPLELTAQSLNLIIRHADLIHHVAGERICDELRKILGSDQAIEGFELLSRSMLLQQLFGPGSADYSEPDTFADLASFNKRLQQAELDAGKHSTICESFDCRSLFLLATFLRAYAPVDVAELIHDRLRMSRQQERILLSLQQKPASRWFDLVAQVQTSRQQAILVEQLGYFPDEQLYYWAMYDQSLPLEKGRELLNAFYAYQKLGRVPDLCSGHQLKELLHGQPDDEIGRWQKLIKNAELDGLLSDPNEAFAWLKEQISN